MVSGTEQQFVPKTPAVPRKILFFRYFFLRHGRVDEVVLCFVAEKGKIA